MLHFAVKRGNIEVVDLFLQHKISVNVEDNFEVTPLHLAAKHGRADIVDLLLQYRANVNVRDFCEETPLSHAIAFEHVETFFLLLLYGADIGEEERKKINEKPKFVSCLAEFNKIKESPHLSRLIETYKSGDKHAISKYINNEQDREALIQEFKVVEERYSSNEQLSFIPKCLLDFVEHLSKQYLSEHNMLLLKKDTFRGFINNITGIDTNYPSYDFSNIDVLNMQLTCKHINSKAKEHDKAFGVVKDKSNELLNKLKDICQNPNTALAESQLEGIEPSKKRQRIG
ncbi:MAG: hypothetical protein sL5_03940 [Candidatus Mesenet longicola]|uniref:Ankyrin repeat domain-containing protein n=1 Tax=Candidatus Mesenet longicola TaxID=1892558 RepID=A0A8J3HXL2_9RICK|nr:MAG: hypothetical protein sGL2_03540 [Candidatus Mesenet longicola]GHM59401.1 MAG: hypothetical protein sL5_03940 [Candidatus Mesenet longicola]